MGPGHPDVGTSLSNLAELYLHQGRYAEAEPLHKRSLFIREKALGPNHPDVGASLNNLAALYHKQGRYSEAEPLYKRDFVITEVTLGPDHPSVASILNNLGELYYSQGRYGEAESLHKRSLAILEKALGPEHSDVAASLNNLAELYLRQGRYAEAEPLHKRSLAIREKVLGPNHPDVGVTLNGLARFYHEQRRYAEAEPHYKRSFTIAEMTLGPEHPSFTASLNNLAGLYESQGRYAEAEPLHKRSLAIRKRTLGPDHPDVGTSLSNLAALYFAQRDWMTAATYWRQSTELIIKRSNRSADSVGETLTGKAKSEVEQLSFQFFGLIKVVHQMTAKASPDQASNFARETFRLAQWARNSEAAESLALMAARAVKGNDVVARVARERQDLVREWQGKDRLLIAARSAPPMRRSAETETMLSQHLAIIGARIVEIDMTLTKDFPDYATLVHPMPLSVDEAQKELHSDETLILFLDTPEAKPTPEETFIWVVTKTDTRWVRIELGSKALTERVAALRCGLDLTAWSGERALRCANLLGVSFDNAPKENGPLPFNLARAHELYRALFANVADLIKDNHLLIVPSGPLTQLPFHVLVTERPDPTATGADAFRRAAWLARSNSITVLPSVSSLKALREHAKTSHATKPFVGFGNPLLDGPDHRYGVRAEMARAKQQCAKASARRVAGPVAGGMQPLQQRGGLSDVADIRSQVPLPETADELCTVAHDLGVSDSDIWLGARANEREIKRLSDSGQLASYRIVHFATHGALAGELNAGAEPGLILTPPDEATSEDDGYLSASEVAGLKLDADWVILSACNTAAGGAEGAEALSGMSRAFFYAGARALLVSHWAVNSDATVKLINKTVSAIGADKAVGRSEALRRSMVALIEQGELHEAHPAYWAPFVVVGEGGGLERGTKPTPPTPSLEPATKPAPSGRRPARPNKRVTSPDWRSEIWRQ